MFETREQRINNYLEKVREFYGEDEAAALAALVSRVMKERKPISREELLELKGAAAKKPTISRIADELWEESVTIERGKEADVEAKLRGETGREDDEPEVTAEELERAKAEVLRHHAHPAYMTRYMELRARYERQQLAKMEAQNDTKKDTTRANITKEDVEHARERAKSGNSRDIARYMMLRHQMEAAERDDD